MQGMSIADVMRVADWISDTTFKTFYYRPMEAPLKSLFTSLTRKWYDSLLIILQLSIYHCYCVGGSVSIMYNFGLSFEQHIVIFEAESSEVQFVILQGSARPELRSELYKDSPT